MDPDNVWVTLANPYMKAVKHMTLPKTLRRIRNLYELALNIIDILVFLKLLLKME